MTQEISRRREYVLWLTLFAVVMVSRAPNLILDPRLWFYEATAYLAYASQNGVLASVFFVPASDASYLNLSANLPAVIAANLVPLKWAPSVTTAWSFVFQMIPFVVVVFGHSHFWVTRGQRLAVCLVLLLGPPAINAEVWLNSGNSQVFCGIIGLLLLCENTREITRARQWTYSGLLIFCVLSGPYTAFLAPVFVFKAFLEKSETSKRQAWIVALAVPVQAGLHLWTRYSLPFAPDRFAGNHWGLRLSVLFFNDVLCTLFGYDLGPEIARRLGLFRVVNMQANNFQYLRLAGWSSLVGFCGVLWLLTRSRRSRFELLLPASFVLLIGSLFLLTPDASKRYMVVPGTVLLLALTTIVWHREPGPQRATGLALLTVSLVSGAAWYWRDVPLRYSPLGSARGRPTWSEEVQRWNEDHDYRMRIWPYTRHGRMRIGWLPRSGPVEPTSFIEVMPFSLIVRGERITRQVPVDGLPANFRLVLKVRSTQPSERTDLKLIFEDRLGRRLNVEEIAGFAWHEDYWIDRWSYHISLRGPATFSDIRSIRVVFDSNVDVPHRISFERFSIEPANIGSLERFLPMRPRRVQTFEFDGSGRAVRVSRQNLS